MEGSSSVSSHGVLSTFLLLKHRPEVLENMHLQERWAAIEECVIKPRNLERDKINRDRQTGKQEYPAHYDYSSEPFSVRRKEFWALPQMSSLLNSFIPNLSHEADGLIFQACIISFTPSLR